jgi:hypothetical protein
MLLMTGATVSWTRTSLLHELWQPLLLPTFKARVKAAPQVAPAVTVTVWAFVGPEIEPLPLMVQE